MSKKRTSGSLRQEKRMLGNYEIIRRYIDEDTPYEDAPEPTEEQYRTAKRLGMTPLEYHLGKEAMKKAYRPPVKKKASKSPRKKK